MKEVQLSLNYSADFLTTTLIVASVSYLVFLNSNHYKVGIMDIKTTVQRYLINKPSTSVDFPFDNVTEVYKVKGKIFALLGKNKSKAVEHEQAVNSLIPYRLNLKCDPGEALILRDIFPSIIPGYHMNKKHWNTVILDGSVPQGEIERMIDNSFKLVVSKMTKKDQASILVHL